MYKMTKKSVKALIFLLIFISNIIFLKKIKNEIFDAKIEN